MPESRNNLTRNIALCFICTLVIAFFVWITCPSYRTLSHPGMENSFYNLLVRGFSAGQLNLMKAVPPEFAKLADPYDPAACSTLPNDVYNMAYYKGKLFIYWGITPALTLFWPYSALTGNYLSDQEAVIIFLALGFLAGAWLLYSIGKRCFPETSPWILAAGILTMGLTASTAVILTYWSNANEVATACGFAFSMLSVLALWNSLNEAKHPVLWLLAASLAYGLAIGSRPEFLFGAIILLVPVIQAAFNATDQSPRQRTGIFFLAAAGPLAVTGIGLMLYNYLRFDNPFEFGWHYTLASDYRPTEAHAFGLQYLLFNLHYYFLEPMRWCGHFPFLQNGPKLSAPAGTVEVGNSYGGVLFLSPVAWMALAIPLVWRRNWWTPTSPLRWFFVVMGLFFGINLLTVCLFFAVYGRYELVFLPALMLLGMIGIFAINRAMIGRPLFMRRITFLGSYLALALTAVLNLLASVESHATTENFTGNFFVSTGKSGEALPYFDEALTLEPENDDFHCSYAWALQREGLANDALTHFQKAVELRPESADNHDGLGQSLVIMGRFDEAIYQYREAIRLNPGHVDANYRLGLALDAKGESEEATNQFRVAIKCLKEAIKAEPKYSINYGGLVSCYLQINDSSNAVASALKAVELFPNDNNCTKCLDDLLFNGANQDEAMKNLLLNARTNSRDFSSFLNIFISKSNCTGLMNNLAWQFATYPNSSLRNGNFAIRLAKRACEITGYQTIVFVGTLATAYAEDGRFDEAIATAQQACSLATAAGEKDLLKENTRLLKLFRLHQTYR